MGEVVNGPGGYFGSNLDAFADCLCGGFGTPDEPYAIRWTRSADSRVALGYEETVRQLEMRLALCHPSNRPSVQLDLEKARRREGPTCFDWLVEIMNEAENVKFIVE